MENLTPISVLVRNERGVLARVAALFARRGFNITSLAVGETENPELSRITVVVEGDDDTMEKVVKQLQRLVCVFRVDNLGRSAKVERGLAMIKVKADASSRSEILDLARVFRARVDHVDNDCLVVEVSGDRPKVQAMIEMLRPYGIIEMARTGQIAISRQGTLYSGHTKELNAEASKAEPAIFNQYKADKENQA